MDLVLKRVPQKRKLSHQRKTQNKSGVEVIKYCGLIKLKEDALTNQANLRDEWK